MKCPHCGAPPPPGYIVPQGQFSYSCQYCGQVSMQGTPAATPSAPMTGPIYIVQHHHHGQPDYDDDDDDDDDHQDAHPQYQQQQYRSAVMHANAARSMSWVIWLVVVLVFSLGGSGAAFMRCSKHSKLISALVWDGSEPLTCGGNDNIAVNGVTATFNSGVAIQAGGNCHVRCTDCTISAPTAIEAGGNAEVTIVNGSVKGTTLLAEASGNARVNISGNVTASGPVKQSSNGKVSAPTPPPTPPAVATPTPNVAPKPAAKPTTKPKGK